jgi:hypothetical protein
MLQMVHLTDQVLDPRPSDLTPCGGGGEEECTMDAHEVQQGLTNLKLEKLQPLTFQLAADEFVGGSYSATLLKTVAGRYYTAVELVAGAHPSAYLSSCSAVAGLFARALELQRPSCSELLGVLTLKDMRVCADGGILGRYYSGRNSTHAVLQRKDSGLDFDWSIFSPAPRSIPPGTVSALHERQRCSLAVCDAMCDAVCGAVCGGIACDGIACAEWSTLMPRCHAPS